MITLSEHTVDETRLSPHGAVLDLGCVYFGFSTEIRKYCDTVICVDPSPAVIAVPDGLIFESKAVVPHTAQPSSIALTVYPDSFRNSVMDPLSIDVPRVHRPTVSIPDLMKKYHIRQFDLIKMDIEGAEYDILSSIDWRWAKQYSIEFHDFLGMNPYGDNYQLYYDALFASMQPYCEVLQHERTAISSPHGDVYNYWDSVFGLKPEYFLV